MASPNDREMQLYSARLATFHTAHQLNKRRKSSTLTRKKKEGVVEWPHKNPSPEQLARAGFFYRPGQDSPDNVQCFFCKVKLDGWEATDDPVREHLAHSDGCAWATARSVERDEQQSDDAPEDRDPMSEAMVAARQSTFTHGEGWPHEGRKGWRCKIDTMVEAGWAWDPTAEGDESDGVTCFYCNLSLDGWEPKDDPLLEHQRRAPDCVFFKLMKHFHGAAELKTKAKKPKTKRKGAANSSTTGRSSIQSVASSAPTTTVSFVDVPDDLSLVGADDSIVTTATAASHGTTSGAENGKKKGGKSKAASKGAATKKKASAKTPVDDELAVQYPDLDQVQENDYHASADALDAAQEELDDEAPSKPQKKGTRQSKQIEPFSTEKGGVAPVPSTKTTRTRKTKGTKSSQVVDDSQMDTEASESRNLTDFRDSNVSAQLQDELEQSMDNFSELPPAERSTPPAEAEHAKSKRGVKRSSDGSLKQESPTTILDMAEVPPHSQKSAPKTKKTRKPKQSSAVDVSKVVEQAPAGDMVQKDMQAEASAPKAVSAPKPARPRSKAPKTSSASIARSSKASAASVNAEVFVDQQEDLEKDEMEIEAELKRIEAEQASKAMVEEIHILEDDADVLSPRVLPIPSMPSRQGTDENAITSRQSHSHATSPARASPQNLLGGDTPSPSYSDKENQPSSVMQQSAKHAQPHIILSPTKTTKIPLAPGTPNRSPGRSQKSPSKQISHLDSTAPWVTIDLDSALLRSPQPTPGRLGQQLVAAAHDLSSPEKKMSVEEWISYRAGKGEEDMKRQCEEMIAAFEQEGIRGLESLSGIQTVE